MMKPAKTLEFKFERTIPAHPNEVFDAWLNPKIPGNPWNLADTFKLDPKVDGLFYWSFKGKGIYGRFTEMERPRRIQHTWVSPNTLGLESMVTLRFEKQGQDTLMTLVHSDLPDHELARGHEKGWNSFLDTMREQFADGSRLNQRRDGTHPREAIKK